MSSHMLTCKSSSATHTGMVRQLNEDSFISQDDVGLWAVADGMGGHEAGDVASRQVTESLGSVSQSSTIDDLLSATRGAIHDANMKLVGMAAQYSGSRVPGSTVVALLIQSDTAFVIWAGDSRIYRSRYGRAEQITKDHSHVQEMVDQHLISPEEALSHPMSNVITRAVGIDDALELDCLQLSVADGDRFLLCSDGLSRLLTLEEIQDLMKTEDLEESVQSMLHTALVRGAPDNVTLISVECSGQPSEGDDELSRE